MKGNRLLCGIISFACSIISPSVLAYDEPVVNLGYTSFLDGGPPSGPGLYFQDYSQYFTSDQLKDNKGNNLSLPRTDLRAVANITQLIYLSKKRILGGSLGVSTLIPWLLNARVNDGLQHKELKAIAGAGDWWIGPALQYDPIMRKDGKGPRYVQRFEVDFVIPIGRYHRQYAVTPSSHFFSLNPYWAATLWFTPKWAGSWRLHYLWNAKNRDPNVSFGSNVFNTQAGQAIFVNFATDYALSEQFHVGINGYAFDQITDTRVNNRYLAGRREKVWALGPGLLYGFTKNQFLFFNLYLEQGARNRAQGTNCILRYVLHFS